MSLPSRRLSLLPLLLALAAGGAGAAEPRYVHSAQPLPVLAEGTGRPVATLALNQKVTLEQALANGRCRLGAPVAGLVPCAALGQAPLTLAATEDALKRLVLQYRHGARCDNCGPATGKAAAGAALPSRAELRARILAQLELRFALSPSLFTLVYYAHWLEEGRRNAGGEPAPQSPDSHPVAARMKAALNQDFAAGAPLPVVTATPWLDPLRNSYASLVQPRATARPSLFRTPGEVVGWAGGGMVQRMRAQDARGVRYSAGFDGESLETVAPLYELAKLMRRKVSARIGPFRDGEGLSMAQDTFGVGAGSVSVDLPAYAVTDAGLVEGRVLAMAFDGGACASESHLTAAEFRFPAPLPGNVYGIIATSRPLDVAKARVQASARGWMQFDQGGGADTWTDRSRFSADLDGDGVPDLRGGYQQQMEGPDSLGLRGGPWAGRVRPVAGWYAHEPKWLMANIAGIWQELARYDVVTCT